MHASSPYTVVNAASGSSTSYELADLVTVARLSLLATGRDATWLVNAEDFGSRAGLAGVAGGLVLPSLQFDPARLFGRLGKGLAFGDWKRYGLRG